MVSSCSEPPRSLPASGQSELFFLDGISMSSQWGGLPWDGCTHRGMGIALVDANRRDRSQPRFAFASTAMASAPRFGSDGIRVDARWRQGCVRVWLRWEMLVSLSAEKQQSKRASPSGRRRQEKKQHRAASNGLPSSPVTSFFPLASCVLYHFLSFHVSSEVWFLVLDTIRVLLPNLVIATAVVVVVVVVDNTASQLSSTVLPRCSHLASVDPYLYDERCWSSPFNV